MRFWAMFHFDGVTWPPEVTLGRAARVGEPGWLSAVSPLPWPKSQTLPGTPQHLKNSIFFPLRLQVKSPPNECAKREWDPIKKCLTVPSQGPRSVDQRFLGWWRPFMEPPCPSLGPNDPHPSSHSCIFQPTVTTPGSRTPPANLVGSPVSVYPARLEGPGSARHPNTTSGLIRRGSKLPSWAGYTGMAMSLPTHRETRGATGSQLITRSRWSLALAFCSGRRSLDWQRIR